MESETIQTSEYQKNVRRAMEGNISAYFHAFEDKIAFLYPNGKINIYNSRTFENIDVKSVKSVNPDGSDKTNNEMILVADTKMAQFGFDRKGRSR